MDADFDKLISQLREVQKRPEMYIGDLDSRSMRSFLVGYLVAQSALGVREAGLDRHKIIESRGWKVRAVGPVPEMRERGLTEREIVTELIEIEIDVLRETQKTL